MSQQTPLPNNFSPQDMAGNYQHQSAENHFSSKPPAPQNTTRATENIILNILLYAGALLLVGAAALLINSVATYALKLGLLYLGTLTFYASGIATYQWVPKLRVASYSFVATGIALIPLSGIATYSLVLSNGPLVWAIFSTLGTLLVIAGTFFMRERALSYVLISFLISNVLASSKVLQLSLVWYFVALLCFATVLALFLRFAGTYLPLKIFKGFVDSSRFFVPITMLVSLFISFRFSAGELTLLFLLATLHTLVFIKAPVTLEFYIPARIYSSIALFISVIWLASKIDSIVLPLNLVALAFLGFSLLLLFFGATIFTWDAKVDSLVTWSVGAFVAIFSSGLSKLHHYESGEVSSHFFWLLPQSTNGQFLFPAWVIPAVFLVSLIFVGRRVADLAIDILLLVTTVLSCSATGYQGYAVLLTVSGMTLLLLSKRQKNFAKYRRPIGLLAIAVGLLVAVVQTLRIDFIHFSLITALVISLACVILVLIRKKYLEEITTQANPFFQVMLWLPALLITLLFYNYLPEVFREFNKLGNLEINLNSVFITGSLLIASLCITASMMLLMQFTSHLGHDSAWFAFSLWMLVSGIYFSALSNLPSSAVLFLSQVVLLATAFINFPRKEAYTFSIAIRGLLFLFGLQLIFRFADGIWPVPSIYFCCLVFSLISLALSKAAKSSIEIWIGLGLFYLSAPAFLMSVSLLTDRQEIHQLATIGVILTFLLLMAAWFIIQPGFGSFTATSLMLPFAMFPIVSSLSKPLNLESYQSIHLTMWLIIFALIVCKILAAILPQYNQHSVSPSLPDAFGAWGYIKNRSLVIPGCVYAFITLLIFTWVLPDISAGLLILVAFLLFSLQAKPSHRIKVVLFGIAIAVLRILLFVEDFPGFVSLLEAIALSLIIMSLVQRFSGKTQSAIVYVWWSFSTQTFAMLVVFTFYSSIVLRSSVLMISVIMLVAAALARSISATISSAALLTIQVLWISGGISPLLLFFFGIVLTAIVVWRLLARKDDAVQEIPQPDSSVAGQGHPSVPNPWDPPANAEIRPWKNDI